MNSVYMFTELEGREFILCLRCSVACVVCPLQTITGHDYRTHNTYVSDIFFSYCQAKKYNIFNLIYDEIQFEHSIRCIGPVIRVKYVIYDSRCDQYGCHCCRVLLEPALAPPPRKISSLRHSKYDRCTFRDRN